MARMNGIPILQIVGFKNSGKTTVIETVTQYLTEKGYKVGVLKHHGHGGKPATIDPSETDTDRFQKAGATATAVEGEGTVQLYIQMEHKEALSRLIGLYQQLPLDLILIEGYKHASYPKVTIFNTEEERIELTRLSNVIAAMGDTETTTGEHHLPKNPVEYLDFFEDYIKRS